MGDIIPCRFLVRESYVDPCHAEISCPGHTTRRYRTLSGEHVELRPGDLYFEDAHVPNAPCVWWGNCDGRHLICMVPDGHGGTFRWNIDGRASNCSLPANMTHRCWRRHGDPSKGECHVDKVGLTCTAGAGSIAVGGYHAFLHNFALRKC